MQYKQFSINILSNALRTQICEKSEFYGNTIALSEEGSIYINNMLTTFNSIESAKDYIMKERFEQEIAKNLYESIPHSKIADIIYEKHNIKVTDTLIESYIELASSKKFTIDPVVHAMRDLNSIDSILEDKIDYKLEDGSIVAISEQTQSILASLLDNKYELVEYMRESKDNFMHVLRELS
jgi:ATP-dependent 26S proteasome regulatory subunit